MLAILLAALLQSAPAAPAPLAQAERALAQEAAIVCAPGDRVCMLARLSLLNSIFTGLMTSPECAKAGDDRAGCEGAAKTLFARANPRLEQLRGIAADLDPPLTRQRAFPEGKPGDAAARITFARTQVAELERPCSQKAEVCTIGRLALLVEADQAVRNGMTQCFPKKGDERTACDKVIADGMIWIDGVSSAWMNKLLDSSGWPVVSRFGSVADENAWLLVQHADRTPALQRKALALMQKAVRAGEASGSNLAYLEDRIATNEGRPQVYGTQGRCQEGGGGWKPNAMVEPDKVDERRRSVGLGPMAQYQAQVTQVACEKPGA